MLATRDYADVVLVDIKEGLPQGKALDIAQMGAVLGYEPNITGSNDYEDSAGSAVVVITAGVAARARDEPRRPRDDEREDRRRRDREGRRAVAGRDPRRRLEPARRDVPRRRRTSPGCRASACIGMAGILDTARFSTFIAWETGASVKDVQTLVLGGHGDQMVPLVSATRVGGVPLRKLVVRRPDRGDDRAHREGRRRARRTCSAPRPGTRPGAAAAQIVDAIMLDEKRILPCAAYLEGEYGIDGLYVGVPVKLGAGGIEEIVELELDDDEHAALQASAAAVREVVGVLSAAA